MDKNSSKKQSKANENISFIIPKVNDVSISAGIICFCPEDNYKIVFANDFLVSELGYYDELELQQNMVFSFLTLIHPDELEDFKNNINSLKKGKYTIRHRLRCKNYKYKWFDISGVY